MMRRKITISPESLKKDIDKYLDLVYLDHTDVIIKKGGRLFLIKSISPPCQYSIDELKYEIEKGIQDVKAGRSYTTEEVGLLLEVEELEDIKKKLFEKIDSPKLAQMLLCCIDEIEQSGAKPSSIFKDKEKIEKLIEKRDSFEKG
ncbi:MAG: hypothetical protein LBU84_15575 [Prevotella sp.]|jgi:hypothetical protein|nr:hypothetical protein [Prevotella sp.]